MKFSNIAVALAGVAIFGAAGLSHPTHAAEQVATTKKAAVPKAQAIDPVAFQAASRMGAYLRSLQAFQVVSTASLEEIVDAQGRKAVTPVSTTYRVKRPDGFVIDMTTPKKARRFIYDGKSFTVFAPKVGYFATISAPATIDQTVDLVYEQYGVILPLADLFYWGTDVQPTDMVTSAKRLGQEKVGGRDTDHYAFGGPGLSWEVWIQRGDAPLPLRMKITTMDDPAQPTFTSDLTWTTSVQFAADTFTFKPATDAKPIAMARVDQ
ncbi:MAG: DUF2092 domain-containing protein [Caulobacter sp.]|nr:DUF2092 domain-containing protein [Caulobacter sp.]